MRLTVYQAQSLPASAYRVVGKGSPKANPGRQTHLRARPAQALMSTPVSWANDQGCVFTVEGRGTDVTRAELRHYHQGAGTGR